MLVIPGKLKKLLLIFGLQLVLINIGAMLFFLNVGAMHFIYYINRLTTTKVDSNCLGC